MLSGDTSAGRPAGLFIRDIQGLSGIWWDKFARHNTGTFCDAMTEGVSGYMDTKNQVVGTPIGTATISINAYTGKVNGHI